jgi:hypothetical protein
MARRLAALLLASLLAAGCSAVTAEQLPDLAQRARKGDAGAARRLAGAMSAADRELALAAYKAVLEAGAGCKGALLGQLSSCDLAVFEPAAAALANLREREAAPLLLAALAEGGPRALPAAWALGMIGDPSAIPALAGILAAPAPELRRAAVRALVRMGGEAVASEVARAWRNAAGDGAASAAGERAAIRVLGELKARSAVTLLLAARPENRDAAVWALGRIAEPGAAASVREALADPRGPVRREAAQALGAMGDKGAVPLLRAALEDRETVVREWAARSLLGLTGKEVFYRDEDGRMVAPYNLYH